MRTRRRLYTAATPASLFPEAVTVKPIVQSPPTSSSCVVIWFFQERRSTFVLINTWRPGETIWTTHRFRNPSQEDHRWEKCVFSNGKFCCLNTSGYLGVYDPSRETWNILPVNPSLDFGFGWPVLMMEHEGDIFVMYPPHSENINMLVLKLNLKREVWEEKRELGGLTVFASSCGSFLRAGLSAEDRNRIYPSENKGFSYYTLGDEKSSNPPLYTYWFPDVAWVDPPLDNNL